MDWCEEMGMAHVNSFMRYKGGAHGDIRRLGDDMS